MFIEETAVFAYTDESGQFYCPDCAAEHLDLETIGSSQIITRDEAEKEEGFYFCDVHPDQESNQIA